MRTCTEDLLRIRDGEPVDADVHAQAAVDPESRAELERLKGVQKALKRLPELQPPPRVWAHIRAEVERADSRKSGSLWRWSLGSAIAAGAAVLAFTLVSRPPGIPAQTELGPVATVPEGVSGDGLDTGPAEEPLYASLAAESAQLERALNSIEYQPKLMYADTASAVVLLEDRIGYVDAQLTYAAAHRLDSQQTETLWRERVDLMNTLVNVRYAQVQQAGF